VGLDVILAVARKNWHEYQDVFEHGEGMSANPVLANLERFAHFLLEYRVSRTIR
jgi:hypothetical protein